MATTRLTHTVYQEHQQILKNVLFLGLKGLKLLQDNTQFLVLILMVTNNDYLDLILKMLIN
jgi:hypothetical protein